MAYTYSAKGVKVVRASRYSSTGKGYLAFTGNYPGPEHEFFMSKSKAIAWAKKRKRK